MLIFLKFIIIQIQSHLKYYLFLSTGYNLQHSVSQIHVYQLYDHAIKVGTFSPVCLRHDRMAIKIK